MPNNAHNNSGNYCHYGNYITILEIKLWNRNKGEVRFSSTSWLQLELQLTYLGIHREKMKQSLLFQATFKSVHRKAWETQYLHSHWFEANKLTRYWPKLYPSGALLQLSRELILPFFPESAVSVSVAHGFSSVHSGGLWKRDPAVTFSGGASISHKFI